MEFRYNKGAIRYESMISQPINGRNELAIDYEALKKEKEALEKLTETQSSIIADLEENNRRLYELKCEEE